MHFPYTAILGLLCDPAWIQAGTSIALCILTVMTLIVLCIYAWDTHKIARTSIEQLNNSQMPFLALGKSDNTDNSVWLIENQGNSAALNIHVKGNLFIPLYDAEGKNPESFELNFNPIPSGTQIILSNFAPGSSFLECQIKYESLDGRHFETEIEFKDGNPVTHFIRKE